MKKVIYLFSLILLLITMVECRYFERRELFFNNNSERNVYYSLTIEEQMFNIEKFRTRQKLRNGENLKVIDIVGLFISNEIKKNSLVKVDELPIYWKKYINSSKDKKIHFYIISKDSVDKYGWEKIHAKNLYLKKYDLSINDLDSLNWTIEYNGN